MVVNSGSDRLALAIFASEKGGRSLQTLLDREPPTSTTTNSFFPASLCIVARLGVE